MSALRIESIRDGDAAARHRLRQLAFNVTAAFDPELPEPAADRVVAAYDGDTLTGAVVTLDFAMAFGGAFLRCGGVSGVVVAPHARGTGAAQAMLAESFVRMRDRGEVVAALYPTTATLYRKVGFEVVGTFDWRSVALDAVPAVDPSTHRIRSWEPVRFDDPRLRSVAEAMAVGVDGHLRAGDQWWGRISRLWETDSANRFAYVGVDGAGAAAAAVVYAYADSSEHMYELAVDLVAGRTVGDVAAALAFLATHGTTAGTMVTTLPPDLLHLLVPDAARIGVRRSWPWMLRVVDVAGAFVARAWPESALGTVTLVVDDPVCPWNEGIWSLAFEDGSATCQQLVTEPVDALTIRTDAAGLAALFGGVPASLLVATGRLQADSRVFPFLSQVFHRRLHLPFFF